MAEYSTMQQYQPFRIPQGWNTQERKLILQVEETFDDIYRRFGRLKLSDMGEEFRVSYSAIGDGVNRLTGEVDEIESTVSAIDADISGFNIRMADAEGNITTLQGTASGLQSRVSDAEGNISTLTQIATGLQSRVTDAEGNISVLTQTATSLTSRIGDAEGNISGISQRADDIELAVADKYGQVSGIDINSSGVTIGGSKYVKITSQGSFTIESGAGVSIAAPNLTINSNGAEFSGKLIAPTGNIAGWDINTSELYKGGLHIGKDSGNRYGIWVGNASTTAGGGLVALYADANLNGYLATTALYWREFTSSTDQQGQTVITVTDHPINMQGLYNAYPAT